jgi:prepilin-type N-terminal cleavage/methylation domain-containing protein
MSRTASKQAGFTLVEISLAMAIFTFMLLVVSMAYINIARLYNASTAARNVQQNNRFAMEQISRMARTSSEARWISGTGKDGLCLKSTVSGSQFFYLHNVDGNDLQKNELRQSSDCAAPTDANSKVLSSPGTYAAKMNADTSAQGTVTISLWMVSRTDLLKNVNNNLECDQKTGAEFCAVNKLTTTVEYRGNN